jgi:hypothetical protein
VPADPPSIALPIDRRILITHSERLRLAHASLPIVRRRAACHDAQVRQVFNPAAAAEANNGADRPHEPGSFGSTRHWPGACGIPRESYFPIARAILILSLDEVYQEESAALRAHGGRGRFAPQLFSSGIVLNC